MRYLQKFFIAGMAALLLPLTAQAAVQEFPIANALKSEHAKEHLRDTKYYFSDQYTGKMPEIRDIVSGPRVQKVRGASDQELCDEAFIGALTHLQNQAIARNAEAIVNIYSFNLRTPFISTSEYQCEIGRRMVRVVLKGTLVGKVGARPAAQPTASPAERLKKLKELRKQGLIDEATYKAKEAEILNEL